MREENRVTLALILVLLAGYLLTSGFRFQAIDELAVFGVARSLAGRGAVGTGILFWTRFPMGSGSIFSEGVGGAYYTVKDIGLSLLLAPFVWMAYRLGFSAVHAAFLVPPLIVALTGGIVYRTGIAWGYGRRTALAAALAFGFGTMAWPYSKVLFTQSLAGLGLAVALYGVTCARAEEKRAMAFLGGVGLGLAGLSTVPAWVTGPLYLLYFVWDVPALARSSSGKAMGREVGKRLAYIAVFIAGTLPFIAAQGLYNNARFGSPLDTGYARVGLSGFSPAFFLVGILGQLLSTVRGVVWFAPITVLAPVGLIQARRQAQAWLAAGQAGIALVVYSLYRAWAAGLSWGPRYLVIIMPALALLAAPLLDAAIRGTRCRVPVAMLLVISMVTQLLASLLADPEADMFFLRAVSAAPPGAFIPEMVDLRLLPQTLLLNFLGHSQWNVTWIHNGQVDGILLAAHLLAIGLAAMWLVLALRGRRPAIIGLIVQAGVTVGLAALMLVRGPVPEAFPTSLAFDRRSPDMDALLGTLAERAVPGDGLVVQLPYHFLHWIDRYDGALPEIGIDFQNPLAGETAGQLAGLRRDHGRLWLVGCDTMPGDPANGAEMWLAENGYVGTETWEGAFRLIPYTFSEFALTLQPIDVLFGAGGAEIRLTDYAYERTEGGWVNVWLRWEALVPISGDYKVFVHLRDSQGQVVAQHDGIPASTYAPTRTWTPGQVVDDHHSIMAEVPPGQYNLVVGLYRIEDGERLPRFDGVGTDALLGNLIIP